MTRLELITRRLFIKIVTRVHKLKKGKEPDTLINNITDHLAMMLGYYIGKTMFLGVKITVCGLQIKCRVKVTCKRPFKTGDLQAGGDEPDWRFLKDYPIVQFQLLDPPRSRTTFIMQTGGRIFIPSGYMNSTMGKIWKHWPMEAEKDVRAILRVDGKLYARTMVRIQEGEILDDVLAELSRKYAGGFPISQENIDSGDLWIFELEPRKN